MDDSSVVGVLAEALAQHQFGEWWEVSKPDGKRVSCSCEWVHESDGLFSWEAEKDARAIHREHVASVVAALPNIAIVSKSDIVRIYRAASTLGQQYMMPTHFGADLEEAERWFGLQQKMLDGLPGVDTVRLEYQDMWVTKWEPLAAARAAGGQA